MNQTMTERCGLMDNLSPFIFRQKLEKITNYTKKTVKIQVDVRSVSKFLACARACVTKLSNTKIKLEIILSLFIVLQQYLH